MREGACLTTKVSGRIADIPRNEWDAVFPAIPESYEFFKAIDESGFKGFTLYYIMVYENSSPVGATTCFLMDYPFETSVEGKLKDFLVGIKRFFPGFLNVRSLICGSPAAEGRIGIAGGYGDGVIPAIAETMEGIARRSGAGIVAFKDFSGLYTGALDALLKNGFFKIESYPCVEIDIDFKSFDEYMMRLSHATRKDLRRKYKKAGAAQAVITFEVSGSPGAFIDDIYRLYLETYSRSGVHFEKLTRKFFERISANMPGRAKYFLWRMGGRLVAFDFCVASGDILIDEYLGLDYAYAYKYHLYFVTFRDIMNWCAENGIKRYESGALAYEPKKRLGCRFIPLFIYAKSLNGFLNPLFGMLADFLKPSNFDNVLKELKREGRL